MAPSYVSRSTQRNTPTKSRPTNVHVNLDHAQRGVAGDNSWDRPPLDEYRIDAVAQSYRFWMKALRTGDNPSVLARQTLP